MDCKQRKTRDARRRFVVVQSVSYSRWRQECHAMGNGSNTLYEKQQVLGIVSSRGERGIESRWFSRKQSSHRQSPTQRSFARIVFKLSPKRLDEMSRIRIRRSQGIKNYYQYLLFLETQKADWQVLPSIWGSLGPVSCFYTLRSGQLLTLFA